MCDEHRTRNSGTARGEESKPGHECPHCTQSGLRPDVVGHQFAPEFDGLLRIPGTFLGAPHLPQIHDSRICFCLRRMGLNLFETHEA